MTQSDVVRIFSGWQKFATSNAPEQIYKTNKPYRFLAENLHIYARYYQIVEMAQLTICTYVRVNMRTKSLLRPQNVFHMCTFVPTFCTIFIRLVP